MRACMNVGMFSCVLHDMRTFDFGHVYTHAVTHCVVAIGVADALDRGLHLLLSFTIFLSISTMCRLCTLYYRILYVDSSVYIIAYFSAMQCVWNNTCAAVQTLQDYWCSHSCVPRCKRECDCMTLCVWVCVRV
jgi:hypothetical protein